MLLSLVDNLLHGASKRYRKLLAAGIGALGTVGTLWFQLAGISYLVSVAWTMLFMLMVVYGKKIHEYLSVALPLLLGGTVFVGGLLHSMQKFTVGKDGQIRLIFLFGGCVWFGSLFWKNIFQILIQRDTLRATIYPIQIRLKGMTASGYGLLDSGNCLYEPITHSAVVVVEQSFLDQNGFVIPKMNLFAIPFHAVGCDHGIIKGFFVDELEVEMGEYKRTYVHIMLGIYEGKLSRKKNYQVLLHPSM